MRGITLRVLVGEDGPGGEQDGFGDEVLRRDQLDPVSLPVELGFDGGADLGIGLVQAGKHFRNHGVTSLFRSVWHIPNHYTT